MLTVIPDNFERFIAEDDGQPVVMLNLLRFRPDGGRDRYREYLDMAGPVVARHGAEIVFAGDGLTALAAEPGQEWDAVVLVRYPSRQTLLDLVADHEYTAADELRMSALTEAVLQPVQTTPS